MKLSFSSAITSLLCASTTQTSLGLKLEGIKPEHRTVCFSQLKTGGTQHEKHFPSVSPLYRLQESMHTELATSKRNIACINPISKDISQIKHPAHELAKFSSLIEQDPYVPEGFRYKNIVRVKMEGTNIVQQPHGPLFQSSEVNPTHGNISRKYGEIPDTIISHPEFQGIVKQFVTVSGIQEDQEILVQFQKVTSTDDVTGKAAVEGIHRDGVKYLGIFCVARDNLSSDSGFTIITNGERKEILFNGILNPGEGLVIDDTTTSHYTSDIRNLNGKLGIRTVLLMTYPSNREQDAVVPTALV